MKTYILFLKNLVAKSLMKKVFVLFFLIVLTANFNVWGQTTVTIGTATNTSYYNPICERMGYNYSQQIYLSTESSLSNYSGQAITTISFYWTGSGNLDNSNVWDIYLGNTTQSSFSSTTNWVASSALTKVYSGIVNLPSAAGWMTITLSTPYIYSGSNIVVAVDENVASYSGSTSNLWRYTSSTNRAIYYNSDVTNPNPASPPTATSRTNNRPNIRFTFCSVSSAPTNITGTLNICSGGNTTLTTSGGSLGTEANDVWFQGSCGTDAFSQEWVTQPYSKDNSTAVNSVTSGILNVSSSGNDPMINMYPIGSWNPATYKYMNIRYRVVSGTAGSCEIFFTNSTFTAPTDIRDYASGALISDAQWHVLAIDMQASNMANNSGADYYTTGGNITGWRFDWCTNTGVNMEIDFISLSTAPIIGEGASISVAPTATTTYYTAKKGPGGLTGCASTQVTVNPAPTAGTFSITNGSAQSICAGSTISCSDVTPPTNGGAGTLSVVWYCGEDLGGGAYGNWVRSSTTSSALYTAAGGGTPSNSLTNYNPLTDFPGKSQFMIIRRAYTSCQGECGTGCVDQSFTLTLNTCCIPPSIGVTVGSYTYSGSGQGPTVVTGNTGNGIVTWSYVGVSGTSYGPSATPPTNAGSYTATASVTANGGYCAASSSATAFTIGKATPTLSITGTPTTFTYNGSAQGPTVTVTNNSGGAQTYSYTSTDGGGYSSATAPTNAGAYQVKVSVATTTNYLAAGPSNAVVFTISKVHLTVTADAKSKSYDGAIYSGGYTSTITGFVNSETVSVVSGSATYSGTAIAATLAGSYIITPAVNNLTATNYDFTTFTNGTLTINKATPTLSITGTPTIFCYNGSAQGPTVTVTNNSSGTQTYSYTSTDGGGYSSSTSPTNVGAYQVTVSVATTPNYLAAGPSNAVAFNINDKPTIASISSPAALCPAGSLNPTAPIVTANGSTVTAQGWQLETGFNSGSYSNMSVPYTVSYADNGKRIKYYATNGCGTTTSNPVNITVNPTPTVTSSATGSAFSGVAQNYAITSSVGGTTYSWSRSAVAGINNSSVTGQTSNPITETLYNTTNSPIHVIYVITPTANTCPGVAFNYDVTVTNTSICAGQNTGKVTFTPGTGGGTNHYQVSIDNGATWTDYTPNTNINTIGAVGAVKVKIWQDYGICSTTPNISTIWTIKDPVPIVTPAIGDFVWTGSAGGTYAWETNTNWLKCTGSSTYTVTGTAPTGTDNVIITTGTCISGTPTLTSVNPVCNNINIKSTGNLSIGSGNKLTVNGNLDNAGTITSIGSGSIDVKGNWTNSGTFIPASGTVNFTGASDVTLTGTTSFYNLTVNKGTGVTNKLIVVSPVTITNNSNSALTMTNGLLLMSTNGSLRLPGANQTISSSSGLEVDGGILYGSTCSIFNNGVFNLRSGTATIGTSTGNCLYLNNASVANITGGTLNIAGRIDHQTPTSTGTLNVSGSGTVINLCTVGQEVSNTGSLDLPGNFNFTMSDGTITFQNANTTTGTKVDLNIVSGTGTKTITGGTFQIGNASTLAGTVFSLNSQVSIFNLTVNSVNAPTARLVSDITLKGALTINGGTLDAATNSKNIALAGNWTNSGTYSPGTGTPGSTVTFNGTTIQEIKAGSSAFYNVVFNNGSTGSDKFNISQPMTINKLGTFTNGLVYYTGTGSLSFVNGSSCNGGSATSFVKGIVSKSGYDAFTFPIGSISKVPVLPIVNTPPDSAFFAIWAPIGISAPALSCTTAFTAKYVRSAAPANWNPGCMTGLLDHTSGVENWELTGGCEVKLTLFWKEHAWSSITSGQESNLLVAHWNSTLQKWEDLGMETGSFHTANGLNSITSNLTTTSFSPFTFGGKQGTANPLPIQLTEFKGICKGDSRELLWKTASEINNDYFTIESSKDGLNWNFVTKVPGSGNSNIEKSYSYNDRTSESVLYYRLTQTDFNGQFKTFDPIVVNCADIKDKSISIFPNPFQSLISVSLLNISDENITVNIYDMFGKLIEKSTYRISNGFNNMITLDMGDLPAGVYYLEVKATNYVKSTKIVKNK